MPVLFPSQIIISGYNDRKKVFHTSSTSWSPSLFFSVVFFKNDCRNRGTLKWAKLLQHLRFSSFSPVFYLSLLSPFLLVFFSNMLIDQHCYDGYHHPFSVFVFDFGFVFGFVREREKRRETEVGVVGIVRDMGVIGERGPEEDRAFRGTGGETPQWIPEHALARLPESTRIHRQCSHTPTI